MPVRRYLKTGCMKTSDLNRIMPTDGAVTAQNMSPDGAWIDITVPASGAESLDEYMLDHGWSFVSEDPVLPLGLGEVAIPVLPNVEDLTYPCERVGESDSGFFGWRIPDDFGSLYECYMVVIPQATMIDAEISLFSTYAAIGEAGDAYTEADWDIGFSGAQFEFCQLDMSSVLQGVSLSAGMQVGVQCRGWSIGGNLDYYNGVFRYLKG